MMKQTNRIGPLFAATLTALLLAACPDSKTDLPEAGVELGIDLGADGHIDDTGPDGPHAASGYVILTNIAAGDAYYAVVQKLKGHRNAKVLAFDPQQVDAVKSELIAAKARYVAVVLKPQDIDVNLARKLLMMSTELDSDPFSDFAYGFITGATAADAEAFLDGIIKAEKDKIEDTPLTISGYAASSLNMVYTSTTSYLQYLSPKSYSEVYLETGDPGVLTFFSQNAHHLEGAKLLDIGENGDPHMLWLFTGGNSVPDIWDYDPAKVENPPVKRVGLASDDIGKLSLYPAVAYNGACHSGVLKKTLVESDIKATFGDTKGTVRFYTMSDDFSFALSILKTGLTGYFAPIGANNANDKGEEVYNTFLYNEPLGDIHKRVIDGVVMGFIGNSPKLRIFVDGESAYQYETLASGSYKPEDFGFSSSVMLSGRANRIFYGDPKFNPFAKHQSSKLQLVTNKLTSIDATTSKLELSFDKPAVYFPLWDKFHDGGTRVYTTVLLPAELAGGVELEVLSSSKQQTRLIHALEQLDGKTILHIEIDLPDQNSATEPCKLDMTLKVTKKG